MSTRREAREQARTERANEFQETRRERFKRTWNGLNTAMPIYTTRPHGGETASYSLSLWMSLLAMLIVWCNVIFWGAWGIGQAVERVF